MTNASVPSGEVCCVPPGEYPAMDTLALQVNASSSCLENATSPFRRSIPTVPPESRESFCVNSMVKQSLRLSCAFFLIYSVTEQLFINVIVFMLSCYVTVHIPCPFSCVSLLFSESSLSIWILIHGVAYFLCISPSSSQELIY